jgi:uncharacterized protein YjbI with pentapeptide repeats
MFGTNLSKADLTGGHLEAAYLEEAYLAGANLTGATGSTNEELAQHASSLEEATMPNGQKYEEWLESKGSREE